MNVVGSWYNVRKDLEAVLDHLFQLPPEDFVEFDSLLTVEEFDELGYACNFPHLTCVLCALDKSDLPAFASGGLRLDHGYSPSRTSMALLPATCYKVYLERRGQSLSATRVIGCIAKCFRHEDKPLDCYRDYNFTMKEFVCLGAAEDAKLHIKRGGAIIDLIMRELDIPFEYELAADPFFDMSSSVATLSKALPTKQEVIYDGHAVASLNHHRNYFGRKFEITLNAEPISTSCVAFGLERWIAMLRDRYGDPVQVIKKLSLLAKAAPPSTSSTEAHTAVTLSETRP
jgi:hypothetical protein